ncbi:antitoxin [Nocardioides sp.]|uniref:antitoxin n=1 Tax=Nocardioides sp. TaxID=35761 RepID=UPI002628D071|nr:antitoxin [Nocardioides sp.]
MSFFDKAKERAAEAAGIAKEAADKAGESIKLAAAGAAQKIDEGGYVDKAAAKIDEKTHGKYTDKIDKVATGTKGTMGKLVTDAGDPETGEKVTDVEYSTEFGTEPTENAADAAEVFKEHPEA